MAWNRKGLLRLVLHRMNDRFGTEGKDIVACIGPSISKEAFEVGDEVYEAFREAGFPMDRLAERYLETGKWHIDLWEANRWMLEEFPYLPDRYRSQEFARGRIRRNFSRHAGWA